MSDRDRGKKEIVSEVQNINVVESSLGEVRRSLDFIMRYLNHEVPRLHASTFRAIESLITTYRYLDSNRILPPLADPFGGWAISADMSRLVAELFSRYSPKVVVEMGSGASTILLGQLARYADDVRVVSLEHDSAWYAHTLEDLHAAGLDDSVELRYAPLSPVEVGGSIFQWYSSDAIEDIDEVDLVLVDGPPGFLGPHSRYPAGPLMAPRLSTGCLVVVDDFSRSEEQEIVGRWIEEAEFSLLQEHVWHRKGAAVLRYTGIGVIDEA